MSSVPTSHPPVAIAGHDAGTSSSIEGRRSKRESPASTPPNAGPTPLFVAHNAFDALRSPKDEHAAKATSTKEQEESSTEETSEESNDNTNESGESNEEYDLSDEEGEDDDDEEEEEEGEGAGESTEESEEAGETDENDEDTDEDDEAKLESATSSAPEKRSTLSDPSKRMPHVTITSPLAAGKASPDRKFPDENEPRTMTSKDRRDRKRQQNFGGGNNNDKKKGKKSYQQQQQHQSHREQYGGGKPDKKKGKKGKRDFDGPSSSSRKSKHASMMTEKKARRAGQDWEKYNEESRNQGFATDEFPLDEDLKLYPEETRKQRREQQKLQKKLEKKERRAANRGETIRLPSVADDPLISTIPMSSNASRLQFKTPNAKITIKHDSVRGPHDDTGPSAPAKVRFEDSEVGNDDDDDQERRGRQVRFQHDGHVPLLPKRRRAQSFLQHGEDPVIPSKIPQPVTRPLTLPSTFDDPRSGNLKRKKHFKHFQPVYHPSTPGWTRRGFVPLRSNIAHDEPDDDMGRIREMSSKSKRRQQAVSPARIQGHRRGPEDESDEGAERPSRGEERLNSAERPGSGGTRRRSRSLIETTPISAQDSPSVDLSRIIQDEINYKADIPMSPSVSRSAEAAVVKDDQSDISNKVVYILGEAIEVEEDREHEFKAVQQSKNPLHSLSEHCRKYINAFLNTDGGTIYFGVEDSGRLVGIPMDRKTRDMTRLKIDGIVSQIHPQVDPHLVTVDFVPVLHPEQRHSKQDAFTSGVRRFVVQVKVQKGVAPVYTNGDSSAFFRRSGSVYAMGRDMIDQRRKYGRPNFTGNVPDIPRDFVGRDEEMSLIRTFISSHPSSSKIVLLHGTPLVGKSSLARQLVLTLSAQYPDRHLLIDMKGVSTSYITDEEAMLGVIRVVYPLMKMPESAVEIRGLYESCFASLRCILLIENAGTREQVRALAPVTAKECLVLVTSRKDLHLDTEIEALSIRLGALSEPNAVKLLLAMVGNRKDDISPEEAAEICKLCAYLPLPLRIAGSTLARNPHLNALDVIAHLSDDARRLELITGTSFHSAFDLYDLEIKKRILAISVFPDSFDLEAAAAVLVEELEDAKLSMQNLVELNEVEFDASSGRFRQNDLLRLYSQKRAEENLQQLILWRQHFVRHYLRVLIRIVELCDTHIHRKQGIELFSLESHNIEACLELTFKTNNLQACSRYIRLLREFAPHMDPPALHKWQQLTQPLLKANPQLQVMCFATNTSEDATAIRKMPEEQKPAPKKDSKPTSWAAAASAPKTKIDDSDIVFVESMDVHTKSTSIDLEMESSSLDERNERPPTPQNYTPPPPTEKDDEFANITAHEVKKAEEKPVEKAPEAVPAQPAANVAQPTPTRFIRIDPVSLTSPTSAPPATKPN